MRKGFDPFAGGYSADSGPQDPTPPKGGTARVRLEGLDDFPKLSEKEPARRDTATLVELLEIERDHWLAEMDRHRGNVNSPTWHEAMDAQASVTHLLRVYREEASR